ncbi:hypothetical protein GCM10011519_08750 [Marmoricola endophyticus]|uniref:Uncharacterized protein n=1 Tax=Marmoricola endophyticus TaxID=2040280 RepID=A0A917F260_9ACTN|nr:hypothetical protein GCM10011519_08750 [Marmoricola endophyticus]
MPAASAADYNPLDTGAEGSKDVIPLGVPDYQCPLNYVRPPEGFAAPQGLRETTECTVVGSKGEDPSRFIKAPLTQASGVGTLGVQGARHAAQWIKIPAASSVAVVPIHSFNYANLPAPSGEPSDVSTVLHFYPRVWFLSADRKRVGEMPPFRVRTLAFGAVPVQVTVHITQPVRADGTVRPIEVQQASVTSNSRGIGFPPNDESGRRINQIYRNAYGKGEVAVRLSHLTIDGKPVDVGASCRTTRSGSLNLAGKGYYNYKGGSSTQPEGTYAGASGGLLTGIVDIPPFSGCKGSSGDDVSRILTNAVSGESNPISIFQSPSSATCFPQDVPGACTSRLLPLDVPSSRPEKSSPPAGPVPVPAS